MKRGQVQRGRKEKQEEEIARREVAMHDLQAISLSYGTAQIVHLYTKNKPSVIDILSKCSSGNNWYLTNPLQFLPLVCQCQERV